MEVAHGDARGQQGVVGVDGGHGGGGFSREVVEFHGRHAVVETHDDLFGDLDEVDVVGVEVVGEFAQPRRDFVEGHLFAAPGTFDYLHHDCGCVGFLIVVSIVGLDVNGLGLKGLA